MCVSFVFFFFFFFLSRLLRCARLGDQSFCWGATPHHDCLQRTADSSRAEFSPEELVREVFPRSSVVAVPGAVQTQRVKVVTSKREVTCLERPNATMTQCAAELRNKWFRMCEGKGGHCIQELNAAKVQAKTVFATGWIPVQVPFATHLAILAATRQTVPGQGGFFALVAFLFIAMAAAIVLLVFALRRGFWIDKKRFLAMLGVLVLGVAVGVAYWTLISIGYQMFELDATLSRVSARTVDILGRVSSLMFLLLLSLLTWMLLAAVLDVMFPERKRLSFAVAAALLVMAIGTVAYSIAMIVIHARLQVTGSFVVDVSGPLITGVSFLFSAALTAMWGVAWRLVETKQKGMAGFAEMRRNAVIFFAGSAVLTACFFTWFLVALLELTVDYYKYREASRGLEVTSVVLIVLAVLAYTGSAVIAAGRRNSDKAAGYVPLEDSNAPARYSDV